MASVVDSLVVSLALDAKQFSAGIKKTTEELKKFRNENSKNLKELNETNKKGFLDLEKAVGKNVTTLKKATLAVGGFMIAMAGVKSIKAFATNLIDADSRLELLSKTLRQNVSDIDAWGRAAELAGGSSSELQQTFEMFSRSQTEMRVTGSTGILQYMRALGVDMVDVNRNARPVSSMLVDLAKSVDRLKLNRADAYNIFKMMGVDSGTATALSGGLKTYQSYMKAAKESSVITEKQAEASRKLDMQFSKTKQSIQTMARELLVNLSPSIEKLFKVFGDLINKLASNPQAIEKFFSSIIPTIERLAGALERISGGGGSKLFGGLSGSFDTSPGQVTSTWNTGNKPTVMGQVRRGFRNIMDAVGFGESRGNYEAYNSGTLGGRVMHSGTMSGLTGMSLNQILASSSLSASDPNRIFAAGKYQMTAPFLRDAIRKMGLSGDAKFSMELQDQIFEKMLPAAVVSYLNSGNEAGLSSAGTALSKMYRSIPDPATGKTYADSGAFANAAQIPTSQLLQMLQETKKQMSTGSSYLNTSNSSTSIGVININAGSVDADSLRGVANSVQYSSTTTPATSGVQ